MSVTEDQRVCHLLFLKTEVQISGAFPAADCSLHFSFMQSMFAFFFFIGVRLLFSEKV